VIVLLLHALPLDERMWEPQRHAFGGLDVVTPRLYGRGPTMDAWAASLLAEVEGDVVLVGASMGGYCALAIARTAPERVRGLVLTGSRADADTPERRAARADTIELIRRDGAAGLWESMRPKLLPPDADPELVEQSRALALERHADELVQAAEAIRDRPDSTDALLALGERTLAVIGDQDPFVRGDEVPAHEVHVMAGCGHLPSLERAAEFNGLVGAKVATWTT
jgi:pimeloyl-ACP methyl ester carboxylesterase